MVNAGLYRRLLVIGLALCALTGFAVRAPSSEKLTISFWIWGLFDAEEGGVYQDWDKRMKEAVDRGFNCVRLDDGAGLWCDPEGRPRGPVAIHPPFGKFSANIRQMDVLAKPRTCDVKARLLDVFRAADRHGVKIILSTWYYLHTNWMVDESINRPLNEDMSIERKFEYFTSELDRILACLHENGLDHCIAYAEIFNEFEGLPFAGRYGYVKKEEALRLRTLHERAIAKLKTAHPDVKFCFDAAKSPIQREIVPRNADVLAVHPYYLWGIYSDVLEKGSVRGTTEEIPIAEEARRYLVEKPYSIAEVVATRGGNLRTGNDWNARVRFYSSLDEAKFPQLEKSFAEALVRDYDKYLAKLKACVEDACAVKREILPQAELAMSEGVTYCASNRFLFEEHCDLYWKMLLDQAEILRKAGFMGMIPRTTDGPEDPSWTLRAWELKATNDCFRNISIP